MNYKLLIIATALTMSGLLYSQNSLPKQTQFRGENAVLISVPQMDTISVRLLQNKTYRATFKVFTLQIDSLTLQLERTWLTNEFLTGDNNRLKLIVDKTDARLETQKQIYETDIEIYKAKAKGKFKVFLYGTVIGALIVSILTLI